MAAVLSRYLPLRPLTRLIISDFGLGLGEHELFEVLPGKGPLLVEHHLVQVGVQAELAFLIGVEAQLVAVVQVVQVQGELCGRVPAHVAVPAVGEQDAADIQKQVGDGGGAHALPPARTSRRLPSRVPMRESKGWLNFSTPSSSSCWVAWSRSRPSSGRRCRTAAARSTPSVRRAAGSPWSR